MRKCFMVLGLILPMTLFAEQPINPQKLPDPNVNCKDFLMSSVVMNQIKTEAFNMPKTAIYDVRYYPDKDYCELTIKNNKTGETYLLSSKNADNFEFDSQQRIFLLKLFSQNKPECENVVEANYADTTGAFVDAGYDFPILTGECDANETAE